MVVGQGDGVDLVMYEAVTGATIHALDNLAVAGNTDRLAFSGTDVFAVKTASSRRLHLWRVEDITFPASALTLTPPSGGVVNQPLTVTRRLPDGTTETLAGVTTAQDGTFTVTDTPAAGGAYTYAVLWDGDGDDHPLAVKRTVTNANGTTTLPGAAGRKTASPTDRPRQGTTRKPSSGRGTPATHP
ncbi:hypothetical protein [Nonomuraea angiospora]